MAFKLTIIADNLIDPGAFETHYGSPRSRELLGKIPNVQRVEPAKVFPTGGWFADSRLPHNRHLLPRLRHGLRSARVTGCIDTTCEVDVKVNRLHVLALAR